MSVSESEKWLKLKLPGIYFLKAWCGDGIKGLFWLDWKGKERKGRLVWVRKKGIIGRDLVEIYLYWNRVRRFI